ncbi:PP2C family protein-serine/threonine phosphatase [Lujinxingia litoralis]|nr:protein phosphatase 2C domain-containing protein [Lujinxingia litoralis]
MHTSQSAAHAASIEDYAHSAGWELRFAAITDIGKRRTVNQDVYLLHPSRRLFAIADGMGGHEGGELAAILAIETLAAYFDEVGDMIERTPADRRSLQHNLIAGTKLANAAVFQEAAERGSRRGMGTTLVALTFDETRAYWSHVGDSRLYRFRRGQLERLTRDHSLLEETLERHNITHRDAAEFVASFPYKHVLTRAVGNQYSVDVSVAFSELEAGDVFLATTDGVHNALDDEEMAGLLRDHPTDLSAACQAIAQLTLSRGAPDNLTALLVQAHGPRR